MIERLEIVVRLITATAAAWILLMVFLSFVSIHVWGPPFLVWIMIGGFLVELGLRAMIRRRQQP
jgi:hypothetical protein